MSTFITLVARLTAADVSLFSNLLIWRAHFINGMNLAWVLKGSMSVAIRNSFSSTLTTRRI